MHTTGEMRYSAGRPRSRAGRARSTLLWALGVFVAAQLGLAWLVLHARPELRDPAFEARVAAFKTGGESRSLVVVGSSLTLVGVHTRLLEEELARLSGQKWTACNLGHPGAGPVTQLLFVRRLLDRGIRPDLVLVELFPPQLVAGDRPADLARWPAYLLSRRDIRMLNRYGGDPDLDQDWWASNLVPALGHRRAIVNRLAPSLVPLSEREYVWGTLSAGGWLGLPELPPEKLAAARQKPGQIFGESLNPFRPDARNLQALHELLTLLKQNGIRCAILWMPEGPGMQALYCQETLQTVGDLLDDLERRYGAKRIEARSWMAEECFVDSYHLSQRGARLFSPKLAAAVDQ